jgi:hypothetical protein
MAALGAGLLLAVAARAAVCDNTYHMQSGVLTTLAGPTASSLQSTGRITVDKTMQGVEIIHPSTEYEVVTRFEGNSACNDWKKTNIDVATRRTGSNAFTSVTTGDNYIRLLVGKYSLDTSVNFEYWFGIADSVGTSARLVEAIGKLQGAARPHVWYGTAIMTQTIKDRVTGVSKGTSTNYYRTLASHPDSATLQETLLASWKDEVANDTQTIAFKVQIMKVVYDSAPPPVGVRGAAKPKTSEFQASRSGNLMLIRPGEGKVSPEEALGLYNMMGHRIATLHPTGYLYQWNGRTAAGADAPTGVYFVQSGSRILGKFFYSR